MIKILLVDDDEMIRIFFRDIFWIHGQSGKYEVSAVSALAEAERLIEDPATQPHIIFLDLSLPLAEGGKLSIEASLAFLKRIKTDARLRAIQVVVYSGYSEPDLKHKLLENGADHYMVKGDFLPKEIIEFVDNAHG